MSDPQTLVDFVTGHPGFPADKYVLIVRHGMGWPGGWTTQPRTAVRNNIPGAGSATHSICKISTPRCKPFVTRRASLPLNCGGGRRLMGHMEFFTMMAPHGRTPSLRKRWSRPSVGPTPPS
jgi:hypothetical protein